MSKCVGGRVTGCGGCPILPAAPKLVQIYLMGKWAHVEVSLGLHIGSMRVHLICRKFGRRLRGGDWGKLRRVHWVDTCVRFRDDAHTLIRGRVHVIVVVGGVGHVLPRCSDQFTGIAEVPPT